LWAILGEAPRSLAEHGIDEPELWAVLQCGLAKHRNERFADMRELGRTLAAWLLARNVKTDITKAPLETWLLHSRPQAPSLFPSLSPSDGPSAPPSAPIDIVPIDAARDILIHDGVPASIPDSSDPLIPATPARTRRDRSATTAPRSLQKPPVERRYWWFA